MLNKKIMLIALIAIGFNQLAQSLTITNKSGQQISLLTGCVIKEAVGSGGTTTTLKTILEPIGYNVPNGSTILLSRDGQSMSGEDCKKLGGIEYTIATNDNFNFTFNKSDFMLEVNGQRIDIDANLQSKLKNKDVNLLQNSLEIIKEQNKFILRELSSQTNIPKKPQLVTLRNPTQYDLILRVSMMGVASGGNTATMTMGDVTLEAGKTMQVPKGEKILMGRLERINKPNSKLLGQPIRLTSQNIATTATIVDEYGAELGKIFIRPGTKMLKIFAKEEGVNFDQKEFIPTKSSYIFDLNSLSFK